MFTCVSACRPGLAIVIAVGTFIVHTIVVRIEVFTTATLISTHLGGVCIAVARGSVLGESLGSDFGGTLNVHVQSSLIVEVVK